MSGHTSLKTGGPATLFIRPGTIEELVSTLSFMDEESLPYQIIGSGSNLLIADSGVADTLITTELLQRIQDEPWGLRVDCGTSIREIVHFAIRSSLQGVEQFYGLPGTLGGAISGNAGCFGREIADVLRYVDVHDRKTGSIVRLEREDCRFTYRDSGIREAGLTILSAGIELQPGDPSDLEAEAERCWDLCVRHGHFRFPSAGSVFRRPHYPLGHPLTGTSAGELIDRAGLKGHSIGGAAIAAYHANIIINPDFTATSQDVFDLMILAHETVYARFGIDLKPEIRFLGDWPEFPQAHAGTDDPYV